MLSLVEIAAKILKMSVQEAQENSKKIPNINAAYYWNPKRGGLHAIISDDGQKLVATSGISFDRLLAAFEDGKRN